MKWILSHATDSIHEWLLQQEDKTKSLIFHLQRFSLRLLGSTKRLFFLDVQEGFLSKKITLRNEYGVELGETTFADNPVEGQLQLNGNKYLYRAENNELKLFDSDKNLLATSETALPARMEKSEFYSLLFGFAWLTTADAVAEKEKHFSLSA